MQNMTEYAKQQIKNLISGALEIESPALLPAGVIVEVPANPANGDLSCNAAMILAKSQKKNPREVAAKIIESIRLDEAVFSRCEVAGPGFLNFYLASGWYTKAVKFITEQKEDYGKIDFGIGKRVLIEFVSANPTGPMHIGNARGGALGDCLASVMERAGYYVEREFYVNDAGNQVNKLGLSLDIRYRQLLGSPVEMPEDSYHGDDIIEHAKNYIAKHGDKLLLATEEERRTELADYALPLNIQALESDLAKYRITYNTWFKESALHESDAPAKIVELLKEKGHTYERDGAVWLKSTEFGDEKDRVLVRSNGIPTYLVPDIAYHYNKLVERNFDIAIDILGADHHGYIPRMNAALAALGIDTSRLKVIIYQMVRLLRGGEAVKLSKRSGKAITLATLLDEVPLDAARFFFNLRDSNTHIDFDLDLAIEESNKNPVYYVQYSYARICSIIRKLADEGITCTFPENLIFTEKFESELIKKASELPAETEKAAQELNPSRITRFVLELAQTFNKFYETCRIKGEEDTVLQSRLTLCHAVKITLKNALEILKVDAPEKM
ncbi:MAG: arginine--tRNA ligase [Oscillospiraceae bacterium]|jgi:arginyl-tRNA synthetase|nr:arginine--tRNA ligase [Oscillospiraceae bacterium]